MFLVIGTVLLIISIFEILFNKDYRLLYWVFVIFLTAVLCLRYGQGMDYFGYYYNYNLVGTISSELAKSSGHGELLWRVLESFFKQFGLGFEIFILVIGLISMFLTISTINKNSPYKILSLFLLYPTYYLTYYFSGIREGLTIACFLGIGLKLLRDKKYFKYWLLVVLLTLIHTSAIILVILPFAVNRNYNKYLKIGIIFSFLFLLMSLIFSSIFTEIRVLIIKGIMYYMGFNVSYLGILIRIVLYVLISFMYKNSRNNNKLDENVKLLYKIYKCGFVISMLLSFNSAISQRMTAYFKAIEILLIPILVKGYTGSLKNKALYFSIIIVAFSIEIYKNISSYIDRGNYYSFVTPSNMPYISIFNKEDIRNYCNPYLYNSIE